MAYGSLPQVRSAAVDLRFENARAKIVRNATGGLPLKTCCKTSVKVLRRPRARSARNLAGDYGTKLAGGARVKFVLAATGANNSGEYAVTLILYQSESFLRMAYKYHNLSYVVIGYNLI